MTQANHLLGTIQPENEIDVLIDNDSDENFVAQDEEGEAQPKASKGKATRRRTQTKKRHYTEDSIRLYLQEIGRIRLLRAEEEIELARKIADLLKLERILDDLEDGMDREATDQEWAAAVRQDEGEDFTDDAFMLRVRRGRRAKDKMVQSNLRLVVSIAKKYMNRGLSFQDLIQEGSLGLIRAAEKFDHEKGYKFSTYATWWIRQAITRAISDQSRTIRVPVHMIEQINKVVKESRTLVQELGREPSSDEIADRLGWSVQRVKSIRTVAKEPISLESPVGEEEDSVLGDFVEDKEIDSPTNITNYSMLQEQIDGVLYTLPEREQRVLRMRFGLDDGYSHTLEEVGYVFNVTRERIRQIEAKAMRRLRHPTRSRKLKEYLEI